jgi:hypothetical protein
MLLSKLTLSLESLKSAQQETFSVLPQPSVYRVEPSYKDCKSLDDVVATAGDSRNIPHMPLLCYAIAELTSRKERTTAEAIFQLLEAKLPWMQSEEGAQYEVSNCITLEMYVWLSAILQTQLWETLSSSTLFEQNTENDFVIWSFSEPSPPPPSALISSLSALSAAMPEPRPQNTSLQKTSEALSEFTGYIATQTYALPTSYRFNSSGLSTTLSPEEEEVRREIRALKGLVLNRYARLAFGRQHAS